jgi:hypothetical protein
MIWIVLAGVEAVLLLVGGAFGLAVTNRLRFARRPGSFRCRARLVRGRAPGLGPRWSRTLRQAAWTNDVLVLGSGLLFLRTEALPVRSALGPTVKCSDRDARRLGDDPVCLHLELENGAEVTVATREELAEQLVGPFLLAAPVDPVRGAVPPSATS